jgi:biotin transport system ATP-binding protein
LLLDRAGVTVAGKVLIAPISLHLTETRIGIVGRNGSGKTTLLRLIAGLAPPTEGRVRVDGLDPARARKALLSRLGILFQNPDHQIIFPTVGEEVAFGLRQMGHPDPQAAAAAALARWDRGHWAPRPASELSQGQRQMLCLISVLAMDPATLLLDEPFAALDLPTALRLSRVLAALPQRTVIVSHDPQSLAGAERVLWLESGRLQADGPPGEVLDRYRVAMHRLSDADADLAL